MESKILISINAYEISHSAELSEECTSYELMEICAMLVESIGFSPELVVEGMKSAIEKRI